MSGKCTVQAAFECEYESHDLDEFQSGGHFVCGLKDENGFRRQWLGSEVHVLTLKHQGEQVLRMMADSLDEVTRLMTAEIQQTFIGLWTAQFLQGFSHDAFVRQRDRLADLEAFITKQYEGEIARGQHGNFQDVIGAAMYYMGKERELSSAPKIPAPKAKRKAAKR